MRQNVIIMPTRKEPSEYDLFKGKLRFTDEPLWFRLTLCICILAVALFVLFVLRQYALPALGFRSLRRLRWGP